LPFERARLSLEIAAYQVGGEIFRAAMLIALNLIWWRSKLRLDRVRLTVSGGFVLKIVRRLESHTISALNRLEVLETGRRRRWSEEEEGVDRLG
jgi:hypothetical protein